MGEGARGQQPRNNNGLKAQTCLDENAGEEPTWVTAV